jgi:hypothetical protein
VLSSRPRHICRSVVARTLRYGMRPPTLLLSLAFTMASCATPTPTSSQDWSGFVSSFAGEARIDSQYGNATAKDVTNADVAASVAGGNARFERWCASRQGKALLTQSPDHHNAVVSRFHQALAAKSNAEQAQGLGWRPVVAIACLAGPDGQELVAVMLSEPGRKRDALVVQGKSVERLTRAFFDRQQAIEFARLYDEREAERTAAAVRASQSREATRIAATRRLRLDPHVGDRTAVGVIIELRGPLALVQYDERYRSLTNRPASEWVRIDSLTAEEGPYP